MPASLSDATVLLTGSDGFTGRYLERLLKEEGAVVVPLKADLRDAQALVEELRPLRLDYVVHLAAITFVPHGSDLEVYAVNLFGTQNLLEALVQTQSSVRKVILAGTSNVYGNADRIPIDESLCPAPTNHYAISKLGMERIASLYVDRLNVLITRPFNYTGTGQAEHFLIPKIVSHFARKAPFIELGNIDVERDFSDVRWIVQVYAQMLRSVLPPGVYNLASGNSVSIRSLIDELSRLSGHTLEVRQNPAFMRAGEIAVLRGSCQKLYEAIPSLPLPIPMEQTLSWMLTNTSEDMVP